MRGLKFVPHRSWLSDVHDEVDILFMNVLEYAGNEAVGVGLLSLFADGYSVLSLDRAVYQISQTSGFQRVSHGELPLKYA